jgi:hypothetical protein
MQTKVERHSYKQKQTVLKSYITPKRVIKFFRIATSIDQFSY